jgi:diaminopimelate decarboxylase
LNEIAADTGKRAPISLRVNPDVDPQTHPYISTGMKKAKFGVDIKKSLETYKKAVALPNVDVVGVDCHIGSQLTSVAPFVDALAKVREYLDRVLVGEMRKEGAQIRYLDLGGGLGIHYHDETPPLPEEYAKAIIQGLVGLDVTLILEPGRVIVGNAGILVTEVQYLKETDTKKFVVVDGGMNDLIRPALYGSYQHIQPVVENQGEIIVADVVGPICESGDTFARDRPLPPLAAGDLVAICSAGAYGSVMSSTYNTRPLPPEVLVNGHDYAIVRARQTYDDILALERLPGWLPVKQPGGARSRGAA